MTNTESEETGPKGQTYRSSHLAKGKDYDTDIAGSPFDAFMAQREREILLRIVAERFPSGIGRYLDFACGTGRITSLVAPSAEHSFGIDVSNSMVSVAREKSPNTEFVLVDVTESLPALDPFDLATAFRFFGNAEDELRVAALAALSHLVRPGGLLVLNNHRNPYCAQRVLSRLVGSGENLDLTLRKLDRLLGRAGFRIDRVYGIGWWVFRASLMRGNVLGSKLARALERIGLFLGLTAISPDMVVVARKVD